MIEKDEVHQKVIQTKMDHLRDYGRGCEFRNERPLLAVAGMIAWSIRKYRRDNKFFDCF